MTIKRKRQQRILLPGGCSISAPTVHPANWKAVNASTSFDWYIHYRFYDPIRRPEGKPKVVKGMNYFSTAGERRAVTERLLQDELELLQQGYNPVIEQFVEPCELGELHEHTPLKRALMAAYRNLSCDSSTMDDIRWMLKYIFLAIDELQYENMAVSQVRKRHIRLILDGCSRIKSCWDEKLQKEIKVTWSAHKFNKYRSYLMILFSEICELDAIDSNPCRDIKKKKTTSRIRETLTQEECVQVDQFLHEKAYTFWRLLHIFFHSGSRETEILRVQGKHVNLKRQTFIRLVKKGRTFREVVTTIKDIALPLWKEIMKDCGPEDYLFSKNLEPGIAPIRRDQISKRWHRWVKKLLGFTADFYSLKHLNTTQTVRIAGDQAAADHNAHTSTAMVVKIYDVERGSREHERMKKVNNPFA